MVTAGIVLLGVIALFLFAGALPVQGGAQAIIFRTPAFIGLLAALAGLLAAACLRQARRRGRVPFILTHLGVGVILVGALLGFLFGRRDDISLPVSGRHAIGALVDADGRQVPLGFSMAVVDFRVERYPADASGLGPVRRYEADLRFREDGVSEDRLLAVNSPVTRRGWRFYLMSYGRDPAPYVTLTVRRDPGRGAVVAGIWMLLAGTLMMGLRRSAAEEAAT